MVSYNGYHNRCLIEEIFVGEGRNCAGPKDIRQESKKRARDRSNYAQEQLNIPQDEEKCAQEPLNTPQEGYKCAQDEEK